MARLPKYPYRVIVTVRAGGTTDKGFPVLRFEQHNYETLPGAWAYRDLALAKRHTVKVELMVVLDESTPTHSTGT